jgi:hypothetical protein
MSDAYENELDARISRVVAALLNQEQSVWMTSAEAAKHLRFSKAHFLRLCRLGDGPVGSGEGRLKRWRRSVLDTWQQGYAAPPVDAKKALVTTSGGEQ